MKNRNPTTENQQVDDFDDDEDDFESIFGKSSRGESFDDDVLDEANAYHDPFEEEVEGLDDEEEEGE